MARLFLMRVELSEETTSDRHRQSDTRTISNLDEGINKFKNRFENTDVHGGFFLIAHDVSLGGANPWHPGKS